MRKNLNKQFYFDLVIVILVFGFLVGNLLWNHISWSMALFNSIAVGIVWVLLYKFAEKINRNRNRYIPSWLRRFRFLFFLLIMKYVNSNFSNIESLWISVFAFFILIIIFPEKPEVRNSY
ncbi:hypothetical protein CN514_21320 [Bacillus sp. AFS001701]|uniref:hypothetical protein n=1 Tax=Bacillus sp. AFS001701 TaxID=2033480 RepID=UPI000BF3BDCF|nr:hypothetical protein [Bacillus sp. AFS001701]PET44973.1 hypothetical protein CN514_21320 [Bacillus sp. AFS001701]